MGKFTTLELSPLTKNWALDERSALAHFLKEVRLAEGASLFLTRNSDRALYFFDSGSVRLMMDQYFWDVKEGDTFGELSLFSAEVKTVTAIAVRESVLWKLNHEDYTALRRVAPIIPLKLLENITQKIARLVAEMGPIPKFASSATSGLTGSLSTSALGTMSPVDLD